MSELRLTPGRMRELRACKNVVFDELLDALDAQTEDYDKWLHEMDVICEQCQEACPHRKEGSPVSPSPPERQPK